VQSNRHGLFLQESRTRTWDNASRFAPFLLMKSRQARPEFRQIHARASNHTRNDETGSSALPGSYTID
jgi:hypothetical protein